MAAVKIVTPYLYDDEIVGHAEKFSDLDIHYERDDGGIGPDLMFEKLWNTFPDDDIFILHPDMAPFSQGWFAEVQSYVSQYPAAGIFGLLLLYPIQAATGRFFVQSAGGKIDNDIPDHYGAGLNLDGVTTNKPLVIDGPEWDAVREVAWTTFGGCYLRRSVLDSVGGFDTSFEWAYSRDVDYCLEARRLGFKIYQIPVRLFHFQSQTAKRVMNRGHLEICQRNLRRLREKWKGTYYWESVNRVIID